MDDKMKAAFLAWHDSVTYIGPEDIVEWTLDYLRSQQGHLDRKRFERSPCYLCGYNGEDAWQPIETAPRDGTTVVVHFKGHGAMTVAWEDPWGDGPEAATWCVTDHKHGPYPVRGYRTGDDTHWRPLPAPPAIAAMREEGEQ